MVRRRLLPTPPDPEGWTRHDLLLGVADVAITGMWAVTGYQGDETAAAKRYFALDQKLLQLAGPLGCADLVEQRPDGTLQPSAKLAEEERLHEIQSDFTNDTFWHELVARLALDAMVWTGRGSPTLDERRGLRTLGI